MGKTRCTRHFSGTRDCDIEAPGIGLARGRRSAQDTSQAQGIVTLRDPASTWRGGRHGAQDTSQAQRIVTLRRLAWAW
ncbi:hypothetical protein NDU88_000327 [Pleurodeles waltl]|uniref:Uncharacterized protein n=1 Tax=Pleurodeles waltl TaxID=8319 RepID=A0AAV7Q2X7_PLEWA|nr:hypothetical protein NDU88_000327 [Pleurodeles waltl]